MKKYRRLFIGFQIPTIWKTQIIKFKETCSIKNTRWTPSEKLHITLFYFGLVENDLVFNFSQLLKHRLPKKISIQLELNRLKFAPNKKQARMIWLKFYADNNFLELHQICKATAEFVNLPIENSFDKIRPHITIARFPERNVKNIFLVDHSFPVKIDLDKLTLWESNQEGYQELPPLY